MSVSKRSLNEIILLLAGKEEMVASKQSMKEGKETNTSDFFVEVTDQRKKAAGCANEKTSCIQLLDSDVEDIEEGKSKVM